MLLTSGAWDSFHGSILAVHPHVGFFCFHNGYVPCIGTAYATNHKSVTCMPELLEWLLKDGHGSHNGIRR